MDERLWTEHKNELFELIEAATQGCINNLDRPTFFEFTKNFVHYVFKDTRNFKQEYKTCVDDVENYHVKKFEKEVLGLYECKMKCQMENSQNFFSLGVAAADHSRRKTATCSATSRSTRRCRRGRVS